MSDNPFRNIAGLVLLCVVLAAAALCIPRDDTDPADGRSGLVPYTDHKTGCQYLKAGSFFGSELTPRLTADGKPMCTNQGGNQNG